MAEHEHRLLTLENPAIMLATCVMLFILLLPLAPFACIYIFLRKCELIKLDDNERAALGEL